MSILPVQDNGTFGLQDFLNEILIHLARKGENSFSHQKGQALNRHVPLWCFICKHGHNEAQLCDTLIFPDGTQASHSMTVNGSTIEHRLWIDQSAAGGDKDA